MLNRASIDKQARPKPWKVASAVAMSFLLVFGQTAPLLANPTGGQVAAGSATISTSGSTETINQSTSAAIINWQQFSISSGELTKFLVPSSSSATLNRVLGGNPSLIYGSLQSNGIVYLINSSGIVVGPSGRIDTAGFIGSTLDITDAQFLQGGSLDFIGGSGAGVTNEGVINASGGDVYLIAAQVNNSGTINAPQGNVGLAAASNVLYQPVGNQHLFIQSNPAGTTRAVGVTNSGTVQAATAELRAAGGNAYALAINNTGSIAATGYKKVDGQVYLTSAGGGISNSGQISAQNSDGSGGSIDVDGSGASPSGTVVNSGTLNASATVAGGAGGSVTLKNSGGATVNTATGQILASGGAGGAGGNIETSGSSLQIDGTVSAGPGGLWLLDPGDVTIDNGSGVAPDVNVGTLEAALNVGTSETVQASGGGSDSGNIDLNAPLTWITSATLQLTAVGNINLNEPLSGTTGTLSLSAGGTVSDTASLAVNNFILQAGTWSQIVGQNGLTALPTFSAANNFVLQGSSTFERFTGGTGANDSPYQIADIYGLQGVASPGNSSLLSDSFILDNNIDATGTSTWNSGAGFVPIGNGTTAYTGTFNGQGCTVNGLYISASGYDSGLFGATGMGATIENVGLTNVQISAGNAVGALVGINNYGTINNAFSTGTVGGEQGVGGLVGENYYGTISNVYSTASVNGSSIVGGLLGEDELGSVLNAFSSGTVTGASESTDVGGLVGASNGGTISNTYSSATVMVGSPSSNVGGLVGFSNGSVEMSYASGSVTGGSSGSYIGGLVGENAGLVESSYATGPVSGNLEVGGLVGLNASGDTVETSYATGTVTGVNTAQYVGGLVGYNGGMVQTSYAVNTVMGGSGDNIGGLVGENNGSGTVETSYATGPVGGDYGVGGLVGFNNGLVETSYATGAVTGDSSSESVGGLVGYNEGSVETSYATGAVGGFNDVGGLVGTNASGDTVSVSYATGTVTGTSGSTEIGGLVGINAGTVEICYATGAVSGGNYVGGLVAENNGNGTVETSYATGSVNGSSYVGGLVGDNYGLVETTYETGAVSGSSVTGGLVGDNESTGTLDTSYWANNVGSNGSFATFSANTGTVDTYTSGEMLANLEIASTFQTSGTGVPNWDFTNTWTTAGDTTTPLLQALSVSISGATPGATDGVDLISQGVVLSSTTASGNSYTFFVPDNVLTSGVLLTDVQAGEASTYYVAGMVPGGGSPGTTISGVNLTGNTLAIVNSSGLASNTALAAAAGSLSTSTFGIDYTVSTPSLALTTASGVSMTVGTAYTLDGNITASGALNTTASGAFHGTANVTLTAASMNLAGDINDSGVVTINSTGVISATGPVSVGGFILQAGTWEQIVNDGMNSGNITGSLPGFSDNGNFALQGSSTFERFAGGTGATGDPDQIVDVFGLQGIGSPSGSLLGEAVVLENNITAAGTSGWNGGSGFAPIGNNTIGYYSGTFNGQGYAIEGLYFNEPSNQQVGLFSEIGNTATIENLGVVNVQASALAYVGGLVGTNNGIIENSYVTGTVSGGTYVGGLAGANNDPVVVGSGTIMNSYSLASVSGVNEEIGGLVGANLNVATVNNCYATGAVTGGSSSFFIGGLMGYNTSEYVENSYATGPVSGTEYVGGLIGENNDIVLSSHATGAVSGTVYVGGLVGFNEGTIQSSYATGSVTGGSSGQNIGGLVGENYSSATVETSYATGLVTAGSGAEWIGGLVGANDGLVETSYATSLVTGAGVTEIGGLTGMNAGGATVETSYATGAVMAGGSSSDAGGLAGANFGTVETSFATGAVMATGDSIGGLVGLNQGGTVETSFSTGAVTAGSGSDYVGGLVGWSNSLVETTYSIGAVTAGSGSVDVGGLLGDNNSGTVDTSYWATDAGGQNGSLPTVGLQQGTVDTYTSGETLAALQVQSTFQTAGTGLPNWDFTNTWTTYGNNNTPQLIGLPETALPAGSSLDILSGTDYTGSGVSISSGATIDLIYNGSEIGTAVTNGSGGFTFNVAPADLTGGVLLTDPNTKGDTYYQINTPAGTNSGVDLWGSTLRVLADIAGNSALATVAGSLSTATYGINYTVSGSNLGTNTSGVNVAILSNYAQDGVVSAYTLGGNITAAGGTLSSGANTALTGGSSVMLSAGSVSMQGTFHISGPLTVTSTSGGIELDNVGTSGTPATADGITLNSAGAVILVDATLQLTGGDFNATGTGFASTSQSTSLGGSDGVDVFSSTINANGGNIDLNGTAGYYLNESAVSAGTGVNIGDSLVETTGSGAITVTGAGGIPGTSFTGLSGVVISNQGFGGGNYTGSAILSQNGKISISGTVNSGSVSGGMGEVYGVAIQDDSLIEASGSGGAVEVIGNTNGSSNSTGDDVGIQIQGYDFNTGLMHVATVESAGDGLAATVNSVNYYGIYIQGTGGSVINTASSGDSADGFAMSQGATVSTTLNSGSGDITIVGYGGSNSNPDSSTTGNAQGVDISTDKKGSDMVTAGGSGNITLTGYGAYYGSTPSEGIGVLIVATHQFSTDTFSTLVETTTGNISINGTGGPGYTGSGQVAGQTAPNVGIAVADYATVETGGTGTITLSGTGGANSPDVAIEQLPAGSFDNFPVRPTVDAGGAFTVDGSVPSGAGTGIYLNALVTAQSVTLGTGVAGTASDTTSGTLDIENSQITLNGGNFTAFGYGTTNLSPSLANLSGISIDRNGGSTTIDATNGGGSISLTGEANDAGLSALEGGSVAGAGVYINNATLETSGSGNINITGDASVGVGTVVQNSLHGVEITSSGTTLIQTVNGLITIAGTVTNGTAEATTAAANAGYGGDGVIGVLIDPVALANTTTIEDTGTGAIAITGNTVGSVSDASDSTSGEHDNLGVDIGGNGTLISSAGDSLAYSGGTSYYGIYIGGNAGNISNNQLGGSEGNQSDSGDSGIHVRDGATVEGLNSSDVNLFGNAGMNSTVGNNILGSAAGVGITSGGNNGAGYNGNTTVESNTGNITLNGQGGTTPNKGVGIAVIGKNGAKASVTSTSGNIALVGVGGTSSSSGSGGVPTFLANFGVLVADNSAVQTGGSGTISLTGTGNGPGNAGVAIQELNSNFDSSPTKPSITTDPGGSLTIDTLSGTDIVVDGATVDTGEAYLNSGGAVGEIYLMGSTFTLTSLDNSSYSFLANGTGTTNMPFVDYSGTYGGPYNYLPIGVLVGATTIDARTGGGTISITGQAAAFSPGGSINYVGNGVSVQSSTLETSGGGQISLTGHGGVGVSTRDDLVGVLISDISTINGLSTDYGGSTLTTVNGYISVIGDVSSGTALNATANSGNGSTGILINDGSVVQATGVGAGVGSGGAVFLFGSTSGSIADDTANVANNHDNRGVVIAGAGTKVTSAGDGLAYTNINAVNFYGVYIQGTGGTINNNQEAANNTGAASASGIAIANGATVEGFNHADVTLVGQGGVNNTLGGDILGTAIGVDIASNSPTAPGNALVATASGNISISGTGGTSPNNGSGIVVSGFESTYTAEVGSTTGTITLNGTGGSGNSGPGSTTYPDVDYSHNNGVNLVGASVLTTGGTGGITLNGAGAQSGTENIGVAVDQYSQYTDPLISALNGPLTVTTTVGSTDSGDIIFYNDALPTAAHADIIAHGASFTAAGGVSFTDNYAETGGGAFTATGNNGLSTDLDGVDVINSTIDAQGGGISLTGTAATSGGSAGYAGVYLGDTTVGPATLQTTGSGGITIIGTGSTSSTGAITHELTGVTLVDGSHVTVQNGAIDIQGTVNSGTSTYSIIGVRVSEGSTVVATAGSTAGSGAVTVTGNTSGSTSLGINTGVAVEGAGSSISASGGAGLVVTGTAGATSGNNTIVVIDSGGDNVVYAPATDGILVGDWGNLTALTTTPMTLTGTGGNNGNTTATSTSAGVAILSPVSGETTGILAGTGAVSIDGEPGAGSGVYAILMGGANNFGAVVAASSGLIDFFSTGGGNINLNGVNSAQLVLDTAGNVTQDANGPVTTSLMAITNAAAVTLADAGNAIAALGPITHTGALSIVTDPGLAITGLISGNAPVTLAATGGDVTFESAGQIQDSGSGNNVIVAAGTDLANSGHLINNSSAGSGAISVSGGATDDIFTNNPTGDALNGLTFINMVFNATYATTGLMPNTVYYFAATAAPVNSTSGSNSNNTQSQLTPQNTTPPPPPPQNNNNTDNTPSNPTPGNGNGSVNTGNNGNGGLANSSGNGGDVGSGDAVQLNDGELNNVSNPAATSALNQALGAVVLGNLTGALQDIGDLGTTGGTGDNGGGTGAGTGNGSGRGIGTNERDITVGGVVVIGDSGVENVPPGQVPEQLQNALNSDALQGAIGGGASDNGTGTGNGNAIGTNERDITVGGVVVIGDSGVENVPPGQVPAQLQNALNSDALQGAIGGGGAGGNTGTNERDVTGGGVVEIGGGSVQPISPDKAPAQLQNALNDDTLQGVPTQPSH